LKAIIFGVLCLAVSCAAVDNWELRQAAEFDWNESPYYTHRYDIPVCMPCWLDGEDIDPVLEAVDIYWNLMLEFFENAKFIDPSKITIHIHDNPGVFWLGNEPRGMWCHGWSIGHHLALSWSWQYDDQDRPQGIANADPFNALPHEWLHFVFDYMRFWEDTGHMFYDEVFEKALSDLSIFAPKIELSADSIRAAREYRYVPWSLAGGGPKD